MPWNSSIRAQKEADAAFREFLKKRAAKRALRQPAASQHRKPRPPKHSKKSKRRYRGDPDQPLIDREFQALVRSF